MTHRTTGALSALFLSLLILGVTSEAAEKDGAPKLVTGHKAVCQLLTRNVAKADTRALVAHVIGKKLDMNAVRRTLEKFTGEKAQPDGVSLDERGSTYARALTRRLLAADLIKAGYQPTFEVFGEGANVIATIEGTKTPQEVIEVTAHFDSVENPGADDNGSGFALVLELARLMKEYPPERSVRFVFMDLEEKGFNGSRHHAAQLKAQASREDLIGVLVLDTIAWGPKDKDAHLIVLEVGDEQSANNKPEYTKRVEWAKSLMYQLNTIRNRGGKVQFSVETEDAKPSTADHGSYWSKGLPAVLIGEAYEDGLITPFYHMQTDKVENLNWDYYTEVSRLVAEMLAYSALAHLPDNFQIDEDLIAALAKKDDLELKPSAALPGSLERDAFVPPRPIPSPSSYRFNSGPFGGSYSGGSSFGSSTYSSKPSSPKVEKALDWIEENMKNHELALIVSEGKSHGAYLVVNFETDDGKNFKSRDLSSFSSAELVEMADEIMDEKAPIMVITPKDPNKVFSVAERIKLATVLVTKQYDDTDMLIRFSNDLPATFIDPEKFNVRLDMTSSPVDYLRNQIKTGGADNTVMVIFPSTNSGKLRGGIAVRDLDDVKWYTMSDDSKEQFEKVYKAILDLGGTTPTIIQIDAKNPVEPRELEKDIVPNLWNAAGRGKIKYEMEYAPPDFLKDVKAK